MGTYRPLPQPAPIAQPAPMPSPLEQYARLMQVGNQMQQQQSGQMELQQQRQAIKDQQAFRGAMTDPANQGKTIGEVADTLANSGNISMQGWQQMKKTDIDQRTALATLDEKTLANAQAAHQQTQQLYNNVMDMPDDQLAANWGTIAQQYDSIPGNMKMPLNPQQPMTKQQLQQFGPMISMQNAYLDQETQRRKATAEASSAETAAQQAQQNLTLGPTGLAAEAKYRFILSKQAAGGTLSPDEVNFAKGYEASQAKSSTTSDTLGVTSSNFSKPAGLRAVGVPSTDVAAAGGGAGSAQGSGSSVSNPQNLKQNAVDMIGQYRMDPALLSRELYKHPEMLGLIQSKYPDWDQTEYQAKNKMVQSYTSGPESRSINAIGTALGHANELRDAIDALQNGNGGINALRNIGNKIGVQTGNDTVTAFNTIVHRLAPEITQAYVQGGGGEGERVSAAEDFSPAMSRQQLLANWGETVKLLQSKIAQQQQQWNATYQPTRPEDQFATRFLSPVAQQAIQRWSQETGGKPAVGNGGQGGNSPQSPPTGATYVVRGPDGKNHYTNAAGTIDYGVAQ